MHHRNVLLGATLTALLLALGLLSLVWTPYPIDVVDIPGKLRAPSAAHWLGTDQVGRELLPMLIVGPRTSVLVAVVAVAIGAGSHILLGGLPSARGAWVDALIMRAGDF